MPFAKRIRALRRHRFGEAPQIDAIADRVERGGPTTPIARTYALEEAAAALDAMRSHDRAPGEVVLLS